MCGLGTRTQRVAHARAHGRVAAKSFSLVPEQGWPQAVTWTDTTFFGEVTAQTLSGKKVQVEGRLVGAVLVATKIKR